MSQKATSAPATGRSLEIIQDNLTLDIASKLYCAPEHKTTQSIFSQKGFIIQKSFEIKKLQ